MREANTPISLVFSKEARVAMMLMLIDVSC